MTSGVARASGAAMTADAARAADTAEALDASLTRSELSAPDIQDREKSTGCLNPPRPPPRPYDVRAAPARTRIVQGARPGGGRTADRPRFFPLRQRRVRGRQRRVRGGDDPARA